jgi:nucleoid-associated protein YgaU
MSDSLAVPAPGYVTIAQDDETAVTLQLASAGSKSAEGGAAVMGGGYGGWSEVPRPRTKPLLEYLSVKTMQLTIPVMFDGWTNNFGSEPFGESVEADIALLESFCKKDDKMGQPPILQILSNSVPGTEKKWALNEIEWAADDIRRPTDGNRVRATALLTFLEYIDDTLISSKLSSAKKRKKSSSSKDVSTKSKKGTYIVKEGDTLHSIASKVLGSPKRWHEIAKANKLRDSKAIKVGQRLRLP